MKYIDRILEATHEGVTEKYILKDPKAEKQTLYLLENNSFWSKGHEGVFYVEVADSFEQDKTVFHEFLNDLDSFGYDQDPVESIELFFSKKELIESWGKGGEIKFTKIGEF